MNINQLILGSASPYRKALLQATGLRFETATADIDEAAITAQNPKNTALERALSKAQLIAKRHPDAVIIGADQVLDFQGQVFDKALSRLEAQARLMQFSGAMHYLHSAFCLVANVEGKVKVFHQEIVTATMTMRSLTAEEILAYLDTNEWRGCVGCYQYENRGVHLMARVQGDSSTIIGLPLVELLSALRAIGIDGLTNPDGPW